jgi:glycosyltransferase involved in cell wall biosynthesis
LRIVLLSETFSRRMGYIQNVLPKYLARCGAEVHVISMDLSPYHNLAGAKEIFQGFTEQLLPGAIEELDGFRLHVLGHRLVHGYPRMIGLSSKLTSIRPDIVQCHASIGWIPLDAAQIKLRLGYKLFSGNHNTRSTSSALFGQEGALKNPAKNFLARFVPGRLASYAVERCYAVTIDCAEIAWRYYGVQRNKVEVMHLGVDTDYFYPARTSGDKKESEALRASLGLDSRDIVCIYTGKVTDHKNPLILAKAVNRLRKAGKPYSAIFVGNGGQKEKVAAMPHCRVLDFMHFSKLATYYRASEIGVWTGDESTSQLDAAACGIPIVISDAVVYREHVDGNGLVFHQNNLDDLVAKLHELESPKTRSLLGQRGAEKMLQDFSWDSVARRRLAHYREALGQPIEVLSSVVADSQVKRRS